MKFKLKEFVKIYGDYDVEFTVVGSETGAVEFIKLSKPKPKPKLTENERRKLITLKEKGFQTVFRSIYGDVVAILNENDDRFDVNLGKGFEPIQRNYDEPYNIEELLKENELC